MTSQVLVLSTSLSLLQSLPCSSTDRSILEIPDDRLSIRQGVDQSISLEQTQVQNFPAIFSRFFHTFYACKR